jgi:hypothetical protein
MGFPSTLAIFERQVGDQQHRGRLGNLTQTGTLDISSLIQWRVEPHSSQQVGKRVPRSSPAMGNESSQQEAEKAGLTGHLQGRQHGKKETSQQEAEKEEWTGNYQGKPKPLERRRG